MTAALVALAFANVATMVGPVAGAVTKTAAVPAVAGAALPAAGVITNYTGPGINNPSAITTGPDGALWFTNQYGNSIGRISTAGVVTNYRGVGINFPFGIAAGSDGALWFTNQFTHSIGRITTAGVVTNYTDPSIHGPFLIAAGSDGALWFTDGNAIGRITTAGVVTHFTDPVITNPVGITAGPDGALWFTGPYDSAIGRITTAGAITNFPSDGVYGMRITTGPDGALWFNNDGFELPQSIEKITTTGETTQFSDPGIVAPTAITAGPDGAMWFTNGSNSIGRITTGGSVTTYSDSSVSYPSAITTGPDGALWFTNSNNNSIGRITVGPPVIAPGTASVTEGNSGTTALHVPVTLSYASTHTVTAHWKTVFVAGAAGNQADPATDYTPTSGTVIFPPGHTGENVVIEVNGDTLVEPDEYIAVQFGAPANATIGGFYGLGFGTIRNDDHAVVEPGSGSVLEGNSGITDLNVPVTLSNPSTQMVTAQWRTVFVPGAGGNQADPATDYAPSSGTVTFAPGDTAATVTIEVNGDTLVEPDEYIVVQFGAPTNATMGGFYGLGFGTILNDDAGGCAPSLARTALGACAS